jgi:hypothetical protein
MFDVRQGQRLQAVSNEKTQLSLEINNLQALVGGPGGWPGHETVNVWRCRKKGWL